MVAVEEEPVAAAEAAEEAVEEAEAAVAAERLRSPGT